MFWANVPSLDMLAQKIDDMLNAKQMLLAKIHTKKCLDFEPFKKCFFFFLVIVTKPLERLPMYPSHRRSGSNIVQKKVLKNEFF